MHCSHCGKLSAVFQVNEKAFCATCWHERQPLAVTVTATTNSTIPAAFWPGGWGPPDPVPLPQEEPVTPGPGSFITCAHCLQQRPAEHTVIAGFGKGRVVCGPCLDELAEALYLNCAKRGVPHWRQKEGRNA